MVSVAPTRAAQADQNSLDLVLAVHVHVHAARVVQEKWHLHLDAGQARQEVPALEISQQSLDGGVGQVDRGEVPDRGTVLHAVGQPQQLGRRA